jgi:hypothetical protein
MSHHPNSKKHKANHCGYKQKPSQGTIKGLLDLYAGIAEAAGTLKKPLEPKPGTQLSLF